MRGIEEIFNISYLVANSYPEFNTVSERHEKYSMGKTTEKKKTGETDEPAVKMQEGKETSINVCVGFEAKQSHVKTLHVIGLGIELDEYHTNLKR